MEDKCPCDDCPYECDGWDSRYCCELCHWLGAEHCDDCDEGDL